MGRKIKGKKGKRFDLWLSENHPFFNIPPGERSRWLRFVIEEKLGVASTTHQAPALVNTSPANGENKPSYYADNQLSNNTSRIFEPGRDKIQQGKPVEPKKKNEALLNF
ncbi:MAG: hypothetical protein K9L17_11200 [Clostridiales bacterium]|nr:hypothetical protein [Clostridiales bacterium]MCF8023248.1 hypothetical protein [Clostridiales bacterium]